MFRKLHLQLTLLCLFITAFILTGMSAGYLYVSEKNLKENHFSSFQSDMNTLLSNLENQTVITHKWLSQMEGGGKYILDIRDNGVPFLWGNQKNETDEAREHAIETGRTYYSSTYPQKPSASYLSISHTEYSFSSSGKGAPDYYGCMAFSERENGTLDILVLEPLASLNEQIASQRLTFILLDIAACVILGIFSWFFTGKLLIPIEKNRQSQLRFVAAASHELRTPLTVILSAASACRKLPHAEQEKFFDIIKEEGDSMSRLISDLLTLAGADSHSFVIVPDMCEMDTLLLNTYEAFEPLAVQKGYRLFVSLPDGKTAPVRCDADRIRQVLSILIHNAFCYTPPGSRITLSLSETPDSVCLSVSDNGPGISKEAKAHVFERFYRADSARNNNDGSHFGLGLSIASEIMRAHHGNISADDTPGGGATFVLTLLK